MSKFEFAEFVKLYNNLFGVNFDEGKANAWHEVLKGLKNKGLMASIQALSMEVDFPPKIKEIVDKYDELKRKQETKIREQQLAEQQKYLANEIGKQHKCPICNNTGHCFYLKGGYEYYCRCSCTRGKDLNRWSKFQIAKDMPCRDPRTGRDEMIYICDINDVLTPEEIEIIKIKNSDMPDDADYSNAQLNLSQIKGKLFESESIA